MYKQTFNALYVVNIVMQSIFSLLFDTGIAVLVGWLLTTKVGLDKWIYIPLVLLGLGVGIYSMIKLILISMRNLEVLEKNQRREQKTKKEECADE